MRNRAAAHADAQELVPGHDAMLPGRKPRDRTIAAFPYMHNRPYTRPQLAWGLLCITCMHTIPHPFNLGG